jgi:hypothetical protein
VQREVEGNKVVLQLVLLVMLGCLTLSSIHCSTPLPSFVVWRMVGRHSDTVLEEGLSCYSLQTVGMGIMRAAPGVQ